MSSIFITFGWEQELILFGPVFVISHSSVMQRTSAYTWLWVFHFFGISLFYIKGVWLKIYFIIVIIAAIYGMGISGTRAAIALPIGALGSFIILSRNRKACITGISVLALLFLFFVCTNIGDDNQYIRKMRSAFRPSQDASYQLRVAIERK